MGKKKNKGKKTVYKKRKEAYNRRVKYKNKVNKTLSKKTAYAIVEKVEPLKETIKAKKENVKELDVLQFERKIEKKPNIFHIFWNHLKENGLMFNIVFLELIILLGITVYGMFTIDGISSTEELVTVEEIPIEKESNLTIDLSNVTMGNYVWNSDTKSDIKNYLNDLSYIEIEQTNVTTPKSSTSYNTRLVTNLSCDFKNVRLKGSSVFEDTLGNSYDGFFYDRDTNLYLNKDAEISEWKHSTENTVTVNFSIHDYDNVTEFYNMLLSDFHIANDTKGILREDYLTFENTRIASTSDVTNVNYDKLGYTTNTIIFKVEKDGLKPVSMIKEVTFDKDNVTYSSKLVIIVKTISNKELTIPKYVEISNPMTKSSFKQDDSLAIEEDNIVEKED